MSDGLFGSAADWREIWRARIRALGLTQEEVDLRARDDARAHGEKWGERYCGKLLRGDREPTATRIARMNRVLGISFVTVAGERAAMEP
jgi:hypothetical protein